jgi:hypothetical protein
MSEGGNPGDLFETVSLDIERSSEFTQKGRFLREFPFVIYSIRLPVLA